MANFEKRKNGTWSVRFRWVDNTGKEIHKRLSPFQTKALANAAYIKFVSNNVNHKKINQEAFNLKFIDIYKQWFEFQKSRVKESTLYEIISCCQKHILPVFANKQITHITKLDILNWQNRLSEKNYSYKHKMKLRNMLGSILKYAEKYYDIVNTLVKVDAFVKPKIKKQINIWNVEEFNKFYSRLEDETFKAFFAVLYYTGMRLGECLALSPSDYNFEQHTLKICKNITRKTSQGFWAITTLKNASSYRTVELPDVLLNILQNYIANSVNKNDDFLFGGSSPLADNTVRRRFISAIAAAGVKKIRIHDLRHSHASLLINNGANVVLIAHRLGHSDTQMTLNTYSHLFPTTENEIIVKMNALMGTMQGTNT